MTLEKDHANCKLAINLMLDDDWDGSHKIVQAINYNVAQWIHAVLHKIEGDVHNSRYWYSRSGLKIFEDYIDSDQELSAIKEKLITD